MTPEEVFWSRVDRRGRDECWLWTGGRAGGHDRDYGHFRSGGINRYAHRFAYELLVGPILDGLTIDHLCRVKLCCNPAHLEAVTNQENNRRGDSTSARNARKTHCRLGHPFTPENTQVWSKPNGRFQRKCRICNRISMRKVDAKRRGRVPRQVAA